MESMGENFEFFAAQVFIFQILGNNDAFATVSETFGKHQDAQTLTRSLQKGCGNPRIIPKTSLVNLHIKLTSD